ncbi:hypothetical protein DVH24_001543 [Malus domestica]|uniref:Uncharacterized protein n=1 Tax=Malus domestica TaxID=3750 RepID=A0A498JZH5_MALDO|nr:hypothetical protein DVH24_001543 [Malus domestica]
MSQLIKTRRAMTSTPSPTTIPTTVATALAGMDHRPVNPIDPVGPLVPHVQGSSTSSVALPASARLTHRRPRTPDQILRSELASYKSQMSMLVQTLNSSGIRLPILLMLSF